MESLPASLCFCYCISSTTDVSWLFYLVMPPLTNCAMKGVLKQICKHLPLFVCIGDITIYGQCGPKIVRTNQAAATGSNVESVLRNAQFIFTTRLWCYTPPYPVTLTTSLLKKAAVAMWPWVLGVLLVVGPLTLWE